MKIQLRYLLLLGIFALAVACSSSTDQNSVTPTIAIFSVQADGVDEEFANETDTLQVSSARLAFNQLTLGFNAGPPIVVRDNPVAVSFDASNSGESVNIGSRDIPGNTYRSSGFSLVVPENLNVSHPEYSIFVTGMYNGQAFEFGTDTTFTSDLNISQSQLLPNQNAELRVAISFNVLDWFRGEQDQILNPSEASDREAIEANIRPSFDSDVSVTISN